ncbi:MAG TPA: ribosome maturation factor RimP [Candidatus Corynebacterium avicola]|uniref:Ribosome maturation factor RimP n=1 Tax=Candidatus Corynebacterium avicola TaxID=2838527 RepID=A0A9D1RQZ6_9CORY|nr:ribosome maturation factor RimP [Candidatus Corynebacterium avicola]
MAFPDEEALAEVVSPLASALGLELETVTVTKAGAKSSVRVAVDADERPNLDKIEELSKAVSDEFDAREASGALNFGPGYTFEVTTPGVDTPLTQPRHFRRNVGRLVTFATSGNGGTKDTLRIAAVDEGPSEASSEATVWFIRPGEKKKDAPTVEPHGLASVAGALVEVEFSEAPAEQRALVGLEPEQYHDKKTR